MAKKRWPASWAGWTEERREKWLEKNIWNRSKDEGKDAIVSTWNVRTDHVGKRYYTCRACNIPKTPTTRDELLQHCQSDEHKENVIMFKLIG